MQKSKLISCLTLGIITGLTIPFALVATLSEIGYTANLVLLSTTAKLIPESISIGLSIYLAIKWEQQGVVTKLRHQYKEIDKHPEQEGLEIKSILIEHGMCNPELDSTLKTLVSSRQLWAMSIVSEQANFVKTPMSFALQCGLTVAAGHLVGGLVAVVPYYFERNVNQALINSGVLTCVSLIAFGAFRAQLLKTSSVQSAFEILTVGILAATTSYMFARALACLQI